VVVMLNLGNETEKPVIDARLRMSLADRFKMWALRRRGFAASRAAHGSRSLASIAKQATAAVTSIRPRSRHLD
jgi:hypothetical protein